VRAEFRNIAIVGCAALIFCTLSSAALAQDDKAPSAKASAKDTTEQKQKPADTKKSAHKEANSEKAANGSYSSRGLSGPKKPGRPAGTPGEKDASSNNEDKPAK
jgi:hypothetical protein